MKTMATAIETAAEEDQIIGKLRELAGEAKSELSSFNSKKEPNLKVALGNTLSMLVELASLTLEAHSDTFEWAHDVDDDIEALKDAAAETQFAPEDAERLKALLGALSAQLREPTSEQDLVPAALKAEVEKAIAFIDENTLDPEEDDEGEGETEGEEGDADPEDGDDDETEE